MVARVFIDGEVGTTGLQIRRRLAERDDLELVSLPEEARKDRTARADALNSVDLAILCLPDDAAREAVSLVENPNVAIIDASTAHRIDPDWTYGFPEYDAGQRERIANSKRVSNPGCYAITAVALLHPLVAAGLLPADHPITINAVSGYSGGGKSLIQAFEDPTSENAISAAVRVYGLGLDHKHLPEIQARSGLVHRPLFVPSVARYRQGMIVQVPLILRSLPGQVTPGALREALAAHYAGQRFVQVASREETEELKQLEPEGLNGSNDLKLYVFGKEDGAQAVLVGLLDNLGKGASGQAVQNLNIMLGLPEDAGLSDSQALRCWKGKRDADHQEL
jgi:N-acetyl-gamma-glutamyl-phosphate reductase